VRETGALPSMFPSDTEMPMVAPEDLGRAAAERLLSSPDDRDLWYVEGPARYTPQDVADAFSTALGRKIVVQEVPRPAWKETFQRAGFSEEAAHAYARMTAVSLDSGFDKPPLPRRGAIDLSTFIDRAVSAQE